MCVCVAVGSSEDHGAVVPHVRLQASGDDAGVPLHQPGAHQGQRVSGIKSRLFDQLMFLQLMVVCLCVSVCGGLSGGRV